MRWSERVIYRWFNRPYHLHVTYDVGQGASVVLLHGIASDAGAWQPIVHLLEAQGCRVFAPDLLGFGASPRPDWPTYDVETHARAVMAALRRARVQFPVQIVGHSMGCLVAVHLANRYPRLIKRIILYEPPLLVNMPEFRSHHKRREQYFGFFEYVMRHPELALAQSRSLWGVARKLSGFALNPEAWLPFERSLRHTVMNQQAYKELRTITVPTDIVYGRFDFIVTRTQVKEMFKGNTLVDLHITNQLHGITLAAAKYLARLLTL